MKVFLITALLSVPEVLGTHVHSGIESKEELCERLDKPSIFLSGIYASKVLKKIGRPVHPRLLMMDIADSFRDKDAILTRSFSDCEYFLEKFETLSDVSIATYFFRLDGFLEYLAYKPERHHKFLGKLIFARTLISQIILESFPYRRVLIELITKSPSLLVQKIIKCGSGMSPMSFLNQAQSLVTSKYADPFEVNNLKSAIIGLSSSCLADPSVPEHEKQLWVTQFADCCFWMSSTRVAMCISAMLRAKRYDELAILQYNFTLEQWKMVPEFLTLEDIKCAPGAYQNFFKGISIEQYRQVLDELLIELQTQSSHVASSFLELISNCNNDLNSALLGSTLFQTIESYETVDDIFKDPDSMVKFSIVYAFLIVVPDIENYSKFCIKHPNFVQLGKLEGPVKEIFSSSLLPLSGTNSQITLHGKTYEVPTEALRSIILGLIRNCKHLVSADLTMARRTPLISLLQPDDKASFCDVKLQQTELFLSLCEQICKYDMDNHDLEGDLESINFVEILNSHRLSSPMKTILLEGVVVMFVYRGQPFSDMLKRITYGGTSLSHTVGAIRGTKRCAEVSQFVGFIMIIQKVLPDQPYRHSAAYAMLMWAMLPRIMDDEASAIEVANGLNVDLQSNKQFQYINMMAFNMMHEFSSIELLRLVFSQFEERSCQVNIFESLSVRKRTKLISDYSMMLLVKRLVPKGSIAYAKNYFNGLAKLDPILMAHAIVEAIKIIAQGKEKAIQLFPKLILTSILLRYTSMHQGFFYRVRFELELHLHLSLMSKEVKLKIVELLSITEEIEDKQRKCMEDVSLFCKAEYASAEVVVPTPNLRKPSQSKQICISESHVQVAEKKIHANSSNGELKRPSRSRPGPIVQSSKNKAKRQKPVEAHQQLSKQQGANALPAESLEQQAESMSIKNTPVEGPPPPKPGPIETPQKLYLKPLKHGKSAANRVAREESDAKSKSVVDPIRPPRSRLVAKGRSVNGNSRVIEQKTNSHQPHEKTTPQSSICLHEKIPRTEVDSVQQTKIQRNVENIQHEPLQVYDFQCVNSSSSTAMLEEYGEKEEKSKAFKLTTKSLRKNATLQADGHVKPKNDCSVEFREYIEEEVKDGILPFKLDPHLLSYMTKRESRDIYKNTTWKTIKDWKERDVWKPKLQSPVRVFVSQVGLKKIAKLEEYVYQLTKEQVARLQSLCYISNLAPNNPDTFLKRAISKRTLRFIVSSSLKVYQINQGWIQIPRFPKSFPDFSNAIALLTESPITESSTSFNIAIPENSSKKYKVYMAKKDVIEAGPILSSGDGVYEREESEDDVELCEIESTTADEHSVLEENKQEIGDYHLNTSNQQDKVAALHFQSTSSTSMNDEKNASSSLATSLKFNHLKATSPEFVPKENSETAGRLSILKNYTQKRHNVTRSNYKHMLDAFYRLLGKGVEYVALDCEMTGLYTRAHEAEHSRDQSLRKVDNTMKLIAAMDENTMFQLGLTVKTLNGEFFIWNFFTDPTLSKDSFTPETFNFLFLKQFEGRQPSMADLLDIESKIQDIARCSVSVAPFLSRLFCRRIPLILFSGYVDFMHILKAGGRPYQLTHEQIQKQMRVDFYDVKHIAKLILNRSGTLASLIEELYDGLNLDKENLHDASYDSLLTALAYDKLKEVYGRDCMIKQILFNYEMQ